MSKKVETISKETVTKGLSDAIMAASATFSRAHRAAMYYAFVPFSESLDLDLDLEFLLEDRRVGSLAAGRPNDAYIAYWPVHQKIFKGSLSEISNEIGCSVQVLYKHRNKAYSDGQDAFLKRNGQTSEFVEIRQVTEENTEDMIMSLYNKKRQELIARANRKFNEDGSY